MKVYFLASFIFACEKQKVNAFGKVYVERVLQTKMARGDRNYVIVLTLQLTCSANTMRALKFLASSNRKPVLS